MKAAHHLTVDQLKLQLKLRSTLDKLKIDSKAIPRWKLERMRHVLANNHLCCVPLHVVSSAFDAGRVGKPSLELLLHVVRQMSRPNPLQLVLVKKRVPTSYG